MIFILRHQEGSSSTNCLSEKGVRNCHSIFVRLKGMDIDLYTCIPNINGKHVRPLQTASLICTHLKKSVNIVDLQSLPDEHDDKDIAIIWHHKDIQTIMKNYLKRDDIEFTWEEDNYAGCVIIENDKWRYDPWYFSTHSLNCFFSVK